MKLHSTKNRMSFWRSALGLIVLVLYTICKYYFILGLGLLIILTLVGKLTIKNAGIMALGILLYFPLGYLNKHLNKTDN
jgi:hypothetical protein